MKTRTEKIKSGEIKLVKLPTNMRGKLKPVDFGEVDITEPVFRDEIDFDSEPVIKVTADRILRPQKSQKSSGVKMWSLDADKVERIICRECGDLLSADLAAINRRQLGGVDAVCRECKCARDVKWRRTGTNLYDRNQRQREKNRNRTPEQLKADQIRLRPDGLKKCRACGERLALNEFYVNMTKVDGVGDNCMPCHIKKRAERRNRETLKHWAKIGMPLECIYCAEEYVHIDHVLPTFLGGPDTVDNKVPACAKCNCSKSAKPVREWVEKHTEYNWNEIKAKFEKYGIKYE